MPNLTLRTRLLAGLVVLLPFLPLTEAWGRGAKEPEGEKPDKPRLVLRVDPSVGFTPVVAVLSAELTGVDPSDANFCHPAVTWFRIDPGKSEETASTVHQDPVCRHPKEETRATTYYTRRFTLSTPGPYLFKLEIEGKDGTIVRSDYARVRVMRVQ